MMKRQVTLSNSSITLTMITLIVFVAIAGFVYMTGSAIGFICCCSMICAIILVSLFYGAMAIEANEEGVTIIRSLWRKTIPLSEIETARPMAVPPGTWRVCGSGGFMGYWGWFQAPKVGRFFGYFGRSTDCFMLTLKDGRKYLLGCHDAEALSDYIESLL